MNLKELKIEQQEKDKLCVKAMQSNNPAKAKIAFNQLYKRYEPGLLFFVMPYIKNNKETAEDLVQEIFMKVFKKIDTYNFENAVSTWLYKIAKNHIIDHKRREKYEVFNLESLKIIGDEDSHSDSDSMPFQIEDKSRDTFILVIKKERATAVIDALNKGVRSENAKQVISLIFFDDLSYEEVAEQIKLPISTVKNLIFRAKAEMKEYLSVKSRDFSYGAVCKKRTTLKESKKEVVVDIKELLEKE